MTNKSQMRLHCAVDRKTEDVGRHRDALVCTCAGSQFIKCPDDLGQRSDSLLVFKPKQADNLPLDFCNPRAVLVGA
jgi:hypothetical protein